MGEDWLGFLIVGTALGALLGAAGGLVAYAVAWVITLIPGQVGHAGHPLVGMVTNGCWTFRTSLAPDECRARIEARILRFPRIPDPVHPIHGNVSDHEFRIARVVVYQILPNWIDFTPTARGRLKCSEGGALVDVCIENTRGTRIFVAVWLVITIVIGLLAPLAAFFVGMIWIGLLLQGLLVSRGDAAFLLTFFRETLDAELMSAQDDGPFAGAPPLAGGRPRSSVPR